jgi:Tol biopolymer transport system component
MAYFDASQNGILVYSQANTDLRRIGWVDRAGRDIQDLGPTGSYGNMSLSPDGKHLAFTQMDASGSATDIWVRDLERNVSSRFTIDPANDIWPVWGADSRTLYWASNRKSTFAIYKRSLDGVGGDSLVYQPPANVGPTDASRDGKWLACQQQGATGAFDDFALPLQGGPPVPIVANKFNNSRPHFSPDGRWVAYDSNQSGLIQLYVQAFPGPGAPVQISSQGGGNPIWRADGTELFFRTPDQLAYAVDVKTGDHFEAGSPRMLFSMPLNVTGALGNVGLWAVAADGQKFLFNRPLHAETAWLPIAVFNWAEELKK